MRRSTLVVGLLVMLVAAGCIAAEPAATMPAPSGTPSVAPELHARSPTDASQDPQATVDPQSEATSSPTTPTSQPTQGTPASATPQRPEVEPFGVVRIHYVNVGQGDGTIWELADGTIVVYDCGDAASSADANRMVQKLRTLGKPSGSTIHALVASHGHLDHVGGCEEILQEYSVTHLYEAWYDGADAPASYSRFRDQLKAEGGLIHTLRDTSSVTGEVVIGQWEYLDLPATSRVKAQLIWPPTSFLATDWEGIAEASLVVRLTHGSTAFCFQGDIETAQENKLASYAQDLSCDVHLVGHHGSKYASASGWLAKMDPEHAVVSFGENSYGHPTNDALCRVQASGAKLYATHRNGDITFTSDGTHVATNETAETLDYCGTATYWGGFAPSPSPRPISPSPTPASPSNGASDLVVSATISDPTPCRYSTVTVHVRATKENSSAAEGAAVTSSWHYKSVVSSESGTTDANGEARLSRSIGGASDGYTVRVDVTVTLSGESATARTTFTPRTC